MIYIVQYDKKTYQSVDCRGNTFKTDDIGSARTYEGFELSTAKVRRDIAKRTGDPEAFIGEYELVFKGKVK